MYTNEKTFKSFLTAIVVCVLGAIGFSYADKRKHEQYMLSLPPEYFLAEADKAKANADLTARQYEAKKNKELAEYQAKLEFEKNASPEYWTYKNAQEERATRETIARQESDTKRAQAAEMRRTIETFAKNADS